MDFFGSTPLKNTISKRHRQGDCPETGILRFARNLPGAKSIDYIQAIVAQKTAREQGAVEVVYVDRKNHVLECTTCNIFAFLGEELVTPGSGILSGITRKTVLELTDGKLKVVIRDLYLDELLEAKEVFITSSSKGAMPVVQINDRRIGSGKPGSRTRRIMDAFYELTAELASSME